MTKKKETDSNQISLLQKVVQSLIGILLVLILVTVYLLPLSNYYQNYSLIGVIVLISTTFLIFVRRDFIAHETYYVLFTNLIYVGAVNLIIFATAEYSIYFLFLYFLLLPVYAFYVSYKRFAFNLAIGIVSVYVQMLIMPAAFSLVTVILLATMLALTLAAMAHLVWFLTRDTQLLQHNDTRSQVEIEKLRLADQDKTELLSLVSHQLKTPLALIRWTVESVLDNTHLKKKEVERLEQAIATTHYMYRTVEDLNHIFKLTTKGRGYVRAEKVDVGVAIDELLGEYTLAIEHKQTKLQTKIPKRKVYIKADKILFKHAVANLVDNAIHYSKRGGTVKITVSKKPHQVIISVADHGIGISTAETSRIFERFYRTERARKANEHGTGLGLYLVKVIMTKMGGVVEVESKLGKGSTFRLIFKV